MKKVQFIVIRDHLAIYRPPLMQCLGPKENRKPQTANRFQKLADAYPNLVNEICPYKGAEQLQAEVSRYITEDLKYAVIEFPFLKY